ncbi:MAG TPA: diguanylate cyclase [Acidimicrobiales bacterium]|nr:diguanylate cyclase [Acidimicrobiales bacterium]
MDVSPPDEPTDVSCRLARNEVGVITFADDAVRIVLGWEPEQVVGLRSIDLIHPDDQPSALSSWLDMLARPASTGTWRGRYRASDGRWRWVRTDNTNRLAEPGVAVVETVMTRVTPTHVGVVEELRAREQVLRRLAEALPVGVFEMDAEGRVVFTNDRLHEILGVAEAATVAEQFCVVLPEDREALDRALGSALADRPVDGVELRFSVEAPHPDFADTRVCQLSLRALSNSAGTVTGVIGCLSDVTDSFELRRELELRASTDGLTGCLNRTAVFELLDLALHKPGVGVAAIFIDLDRFKEVNDRRGHALGDRVLCIAAERIRGAVRSGDSVGRLGGDEFLVICPDVAGAEAAVPVAGRVSEALRRPVEVEGESFLIGASVGVAWSPPGGQSSDVLIARADRAMYESKLGGHGAVAVAG